MKNLYRIIKGDYLQRSRSYAFLITMAITIYAAYHFVPTPQENYTTLTIPGYKGAYNSAWAGHISALMSTLTLGMFGFFLVNGGIKKDIDTEVGLIIATTPVSNLRYLLIKFISSLSILLTISGLAILVGMLMFFIKSTGYPFYLKDFLLPYFFMVLPAMIVVAGLAVLAEVLLNGKSILQGLIYFFLFFTLITTHVFQGSSAATDAFGISEVTNSIQNQVSTQFHEKISGISIGYSVGEKESYKLFVWEGVSWSEIYLLSRIMWISLILILMCLSSFLFHRFDFKQTIPVLKKIPQVYFGATVTVNSTQFNKSALLPIVQAFGILPLIKTELLLMVRKDSKLLWILNAGLWISLFFVPLPIAYIFLLPILFFLQVNRISDLATRDQTYRLHYFTYCSYRPMQRILPAQLLAGLTLFLALALPVICRLLIAANFVAALQVINGALLIILLSISIGIVSGGKKLFEILFLLLTYIVLQTPQIHYLGNMSKSNYGQAIAFVGLTNMILLTSSFIVRRNQLRSL